MKVFIEGEGKVEVKEETTYLTLSKDMGYHKDHIITLENEKPVPMDKIIEDGVNIKFINVVSGG
ncbi:MAG: MoaD/ThiS family protein [Thermoplasmata archaeon]